MKIYILIFKTYRTYNNRFEILEIYHNQDDVRKHLNELYEKVVVKPFLNTYKYDNGFSFSSNGVGFISGCYEILEREVK